jgi:hypothetical protein
VPQARSSQAVVARSIPAGPACARPLRRAGDQDDRESPPECATGARWSRSTGSRARRQLGELCERLGATAVRLIVGDAAEIDLGGGYDRVLVDPPCSDLGTLASRPDARWRKSPELIERVAGVQAAILDRAVDALNADGALTLLGLHHLRSGGSGSHVEPLVASGRVQARGPRARPSCGPTMTERTGSSSPEWSAPRWKLP